MERLVYDGVWLEEYVSEIDRQRNELTAMRECLIRGKDSLMPIQIPFYLEVMEKIEHVDQNFRSMKETANRFLEEMRTLSLDLENFSNETREMLWNSLE